NAAGGTLASLWTPATSDATALTLAGGAIAGRALALQEAGWTGRLALHDAHHSFPLLGNQPHLQLNLWQTGVSGSGMAFRLPISPWLALPILGVTNEAK